VALLTLHVHRRSVLVIADRVEFLEKVKEYIGETCLLVTGDTPTEEDKQLKSNYSIKQKCALLVAGKSLVKASQLTS